MTFRSALVTFSPLVLSTGCAGLIGPPLGLGPEWDGLATLAIVALFVAVAYRHLGARMLARKREGKTSAAMKIVQQRYARGKIGREEYQRVTHDLS